MEATVVYWYVLYDILLDAGLDTWLVNGRQTRQLPGRKQMSKIVSGYNSCTVMDH
jgi:hypothetical protein